MRLTRRTWVGFLVIVVGTLVIISWSFYSMHEPNMPITEPDEDILKLPEPQFQGMSLDEALMRTYLASCFSNDTLSDGPSLSQSSQYIFYTPHN